MKKEQLRESPGLISPVYYGYFVVAASFFNIMVIFAAFYSYGVFFTPLLDEFGWSKAMTSGAFSLASMIYGLMSILMGGLNDRLGPK